MTDYKWKQIGGDMNPGSSGAILACEDDHGVEVREIQPVRDCVGDREAAEVGFPFWTRDSYYYWKELVLGTEDSHRDLQSALETTGYDSDSDSLPSHPHHRALALAEILSLYGAGREEGPCGWAKDVVPGEVEWWGGTAGPEFLSDEEEDFRRDILNEGDEDDS